MTYPIWGLYTTVKYKSLIPIYTQCLGPKTYLLYEKKHAPHIYPLGPWGPWHTAMWPNIPIGMYLSSSLSSTPGLSPRDALVPVKKCVPHIYLWGPGAQAVSHMGPISTWNLLEFKSYQSTRFRPWGCFICWENACPVYTHLDPWDPWPLPSGVESTKRWI